MIMSEFVDILPSRTSAPIRQAPVVFAVRKLQGKLKVVIRLRDDILKELGWQIGDTVVPAVDRQARRLAVRVADNSASGYKLVKDLGGAALSFQSREDLGFPQATVKACSVEYAAANEGLVLDFSAVA